MLCEECHQNEAVYTISVMMGEAMTQRHLLSLYCWQVLEGCQKS